MKMQEVMNAGSSSYIARTPPRGAMAYFQMNTIAAPENIPAIAPHLLQRFQNSENRTMGPKVAPKPAHAKDTTRKMELVGSSANRMPQMATQITVTRATIMLFLSLSSMPSTPRMMFWAMALAAARS